MDRISGSVAQYQKVENSCYWGPILEGENKDFHADKIFEDKMAESVPYLVKGINLQSIESLCESNTE